MYAFRVSMDVGCETRNGTRVGGEVSQEERKLLGVREYKGRKDGKESTKTNCI